MSKTNLKCHLLLLAKIAQQQHHQRIQQQQQQQMQQQLQQQQQSMQQVNQQSMQGSNQPLRNLLQQVWVDSSFLFSVYKNYTQVKIGP